MAVKSEDEEPQQAEESFRGDLKRIRSWLREKSRVILIVCLWTALLSFVISWEYYNLYQSNPFLLQPGYKVAFASAYATYIPKLYTLDYVVILAASLLAGYAIADVEDTLFGFLISGVLSILIGVAYSTFFIWYVLFGSVLDPSMLETIMWLAFLNIFRMIFPVALLTVFLGSIFGSLFRGVVQPSAGD